MAVKTQGTNIYFIDAGATGGPAVVTVQCAVGLSGMGGSRDQIDITCLEDLARNYEAGLISPGTATLTLNLDPQNASHVRMHQLYADGTKFDVAVGFSDGTAAPTLDTNDQFDLPASRSFLVSNQTYIADFPADFNQNDVVKSGVTLQLSGLKTLFPKV